jgi:hypothetical protein
MNGECSVSQAERHNGRSRDTQVDKELGEYQLLLAPNCVPINVMFRGYAH